MTLLKRKRKRTICKWERRYIREMEARWITTFQIFLMGALFGIFCAAVMVLTPYG